jgi:hypothetical protein
MRKFGSEARKPAGHRLQPSYFLFSAPEGGEKTRLGGAPRREEQLIHRAGLSTDRDGTDDDLSRGFFHLPSLAPARPESHRSRGHHVRLDHLKLNSLTDQRPRKGWSRPRIVETRDTFLFHTTSTKNTYRSKNNKYLVTYVFWTVSPLPMERLGLVVYGLLQHISSQIIGVERGGQRQQPVYIGIVVNNFISF